MPLPSLNGRPTSIDGLAVNVIKGPHRLLGRADDGDERHCSEIANITDNKTIGSEQEGQER
jgi:hypothetical protein